VSSRSETADSTTYGHRIIEETPVTAITTYIATSEGEITEHDEEATPDRDHATYRCTCGDSFDTYDEAIDHIETKAHGITRDQLTEISTEAKGTTYYGFECLGLTAHTNCIQWRHETLDIIVYATPGFRDSNAIDISVRARCGAEEVINDDVYREAEIFAHLAKWYGDTERYDDYIAVDRRFGQAFGLIEDGDGTGDHGASIEVTDTEIKVPGVGFETRDTTSVTDEEPDDDEPDDTDSTEDDEPSISRVERIINEQMGYVDNWYTDPDDDAYVETDTYLRAAFTDLIETLTQDYTLWTDCNLRYNLSTSDHPFVYPTSTTTPSVDQVVLDPQDFQRSDIRELLRYGVRLEEDRSSADRDRILDLVGTHMTTYARQWRAKLRATYIEDSTVYYKYNPSYGFDDFVLASYTWVVLLDDPWNELTAATVNDRFGSGEAYTLDSTLHTALHEELAPEAREYMEAFMDYADAFEKLVAERFGVSDSVLDVPRLRQWLNRHSPYDVLNRLRADPEDLNFRVRFDTDTKLEDMVTLAYRAQKSLDEEEDEVRGYTTADTVLDELAGTDMEAVETKVDLLENYSVDRSMYGSLMQFASYTQQDVDTVVAASELCHDTLGQSTQERIHKMLIEYKLTEADLVEAFTAIDFETDQSSTAFASRFQEVSEYYAGDE
jgi:hypothetical protein